MAATGGTNRGTRDSSSSSFAYNIPLHQLRVLARAAQGEKCVKLYQSQPRPLSVPSASLPSDPPSSVGEDSRRSCSVKGEEVSRSKVSGQHIKTKLQQLHGRSKIPTSQVKKSAKKSLPAEVSNRRPHYATGQPRRHDALSLLACKNVVGICENNQGESREKHLLARAMGCSGKEGKSGQHMVCTANGDLSSIKLLSKRTEFERERDVQDSRKHQHVSGKESVGFQAKMCENREHSISSTSQRTAEEKRLSRIRQEREAALRRHLKSLRSLRMRLAIEGKGAVKNCALRVGREVRDPRFSEACGPLNLQMVSKAYAFLNDMRKEEAEQLQQFLKKSVRGNGLGPPWLREGSERGGAARQVDAQKDAARKALQRLRSQEDARKRKGVELVVKGRLAQEEKARIAQTGKRPFFVRRNEMRRLVQAEWQKVQHGGKAPLHRRVAKQEEKKARNKLAKERRQNAIPLRRSVVEKANA